MKWIQEKRQHRLVVPETEETLAIYGTVQRRDEDVTFFSHTNDILQVGMLCGNRRSVPLHRHKPHMRMTCGTMEVLLVIKGGLHVCFQYGNEDATLTLGEHQFVMIYPGVNHAVEIEEGSLIFEVKNGPYKGQAEDKEYIKSPQPKPFDPTDL